MCSIGEDDFGDEGGLHAMVPSADPIPVENTGSCAKCGQPGALYRTSCRECFLIQTRHKFRAALGASRVLPRDADVLLIFDGSAEALVLLDMLHYAQAQNAFKRLHCKVRVLYIDDCIITEEQATQELFQAVLGTLKRYELFESYIIATAGTTPVSLQDESSLAAYQARDLTAERQFASDVKTIKSLSSRQDFLQHQRTSQIASAAKQLGCQFAFLPDTSANLAIKLLTGIALGRGSSVASDVALTDERHDVKLVRPLRDLNELDVQLYLKAQQLTPLSTQRYGESKGSVASLQNMTTAFVNNLQQNYNSTVSTVFRTGDKIAPKCHLTADTAAMSLDQDKSHSQPTTCRYCHSRLDYLGSTTLLAIEFSRLVSDVGATIDERANYAKQAAINVNGTHDEEMATFCHACRNIRRDCDRNKLMLS